MSIRLEVSVVDEAVERVDADVAIVGCLSDERPLRGAAARADWRLCGAISRLLLAGDLAGEEGEAALFPSGGGVRAPRVMALGLGPRDRRRALRLRAFARDALGRALGLRAQQPALALLPAEYGEVRDQVEELVAGLAEALEANDAPGGEGERVMALRLVVGEDALAAAKQALEQLASHHWPDGIAFSST